MKKINTFTMELIITISHIIFLLILITPIRNNFPSFSYYIFALIAFVWFAGFTYYYVKDSTDDERDLEHTKLSSRVAFLLGVAILMIAVFIQSLNGEVDLWIPLALGTMVVTKTLSLIYFKITK